MNSHDNNFAGNEPHHVTGGIHIMKPRSIAMFVVISLVSGCSNLPLNTIPDVEKLVATDGAAKNCGALFGRTREESAPQAVPSVAESRPAFPASR
jgi:hypothetical protein